jgi:hypothetical protein
MRATSTGVAAKMDIPSAYITMLKWTTRRGSTDASSRAHRKAPMGPDALRASIAAWAFESTVEEY